MVFRKEDPKILLPLAIYPPGLDLSGHIILWPDGSMDEWSKELAEKCREIEQDGQDGPQPEDAGGDPSTGFYRVVRNGAHLFGLTNGMVLSGIVDLPVEIGLVALESVALMVDGDNPAKADIVTNSIEQLVLRWNTAFAPNGTHSIWLEATRDFDNQPPIRSSTNSVTITNDVSFVDFTSTFGSQMWILAFLTMQSADYQVKVYDGQSTNYLGAFPVDTTTDGMISFIWDLTDGLGNTFTNESFRLDFYVGPPSGARSLAGSMTNGKEDGWGGDYFAVARAEHSYDGVFEDYHPCVYQGAVQILGSPALDEYHLSPGNIWGGDTTFQYVIQTKTNLLEYLADSSYRNFFWWGHGNPHEIGCSYFSGTDANGDPIRTNRVPTSAEEIRKLLGNTPTIRRHPYRMVFIHSCNSASTRKFSNAFGIPKDVVNVAQFQFSGLRARAFVGSTGLTPQVDESVQLRYAESLALFFSNWMQDYPVNQCLYSATNPPSSGFRIPLPTTTTSQWVIFGAQNLQRYGP